MKPLWSILGLCLAWAVFVPDVPAADKRPNILYIMADDHAAHAISAYGSKINKTPNLDRIARDGMRFDQLLRHQLHLHAEPGRHPHGQVQPHQRRARLQPLRRQPAHARQVSAGGRLSHRHDRQVAPGQRSDRLRSTGTSCPARGSTTTRSSDRRWASTEASRATPPTSSPTFPSQFLKDRPKDKPFFLMCHHKAPHRPWQPDEKHRQAVARTSSARTRDVQRRLRHALRRRPRGHHADRPTT